MHFANVERLCGVLTVFTACSMAFAHGSNDVANAVGPPLVGAVLGVGLARGIGALNLRVIGGILMSWLVTLPAGSFLSILVFFLLKALL